MLSFSRWLFGEGATELRLPVAWLCAVQAWSGWLMLFWRPVFHPWRSPIVLVGLGGLLLLRGSRRDIDLRAATAAWPRFVIVLIALGLVADLGMAAYTGTRVFQTRHIPNDQGQTTWRAVRLLWQGHDPYGLGALVDTTAYLRRQGARANTPLASDVEAKSVGSALKRYKSTLDPVLGRRLLPVHRSLRGKLRFEARLYGYKYGPVILLVTALFAPLHHPAAVVLINIILTAILFLLLFFLLRHISEEYSVLASLCLGSLLLERSITHGYLSHSCTDIWALVPMTGAVLCHLRKRDAAVGVLLGIAVASKIFPSLIVAPLLLCHRPQVRLSAFVVTVILMFTPFLISDPMGVIANVWLWPMMMVKLPSSWIYFVPSYMATAGRLLISFVIVFSWWRYLSGRETRLLWTLALVSTLLLLTGNTFDNNYVPWASIWMEVAVAEAMMVAARGNEARIAINHGLPLAVAAGGLLDTPGRGR